jgi:hypothetical protein
MQLKHWIDERKLDLRAMDHLGRGKHEYWMKHMRIVWIKRALAYFMQLLPQRTY